MWYPVQAVQYVDINLSQMTGSAAERMKTKFYSKLRCSKMGLLKIFKISGRTVAVDEVGLQNAVSFDHIPSTPTPKNPVRNLTSPRTAAKTNC